MMEEEITKDVKELDSTTTTHEDAVKVSVKLSKKPTLVTIQYTAKAHNVVKWSYEDVTPEIAKQLVDAGAARIINN